MVSFINCGFDLTPHWNEIYEKFIEPSFGITSREEKYPSKHWLKKPRKQDLRLSQNNLCYKPPYKKMKKEINEPKAPWAMKPGIPRPYKSMTSVYIKTNLDLEHATDKKMYNKNQYNR